MASARKIILVDQDGPLAQFDARLTEILHTQFPELPYPSGDAIKNFYFADRYPAEYKAAIKKIYTSEGFVLSLQPVPGAREALEEMLAGGFDVRICSSPISSSDYCIQEKHAWVKKNLGDAWADRLILAKDKTLIRGNYLIDDRLDISGVMVPLWEHVVYDTPHNQGSPGKRLVRWSDWRSVLGVI